MKILAIRLITLLGEQKKKKKLAEVGNTGEEGPLTFNSKYAGSLSRTYRARVPKTCGADQCWASLSDFPRTSRLEGGKNGGLEKRREKKNAG